jgi:hypothetical protein
LFGTGLWLDHVDWWTDHAFLLNVASSVTGVCFGGPIAVLLFNQLSSAQDEARQTERARAQAGTQAAEFQSALLSLFTTTDLAGLTATAQALRQQIDTIRSLNRDAPPKTRPSRASSPTSMHCCQARRDVPAVVFDRSLSAATSWRR